MYRPLRPGYYWMLVFLAVLSWSGSLLGASGQTVAPGTILRPIVGSRVVFSRLRSGTVLNGEFKDPAYHLDREVIPAGSVVRVIVDEARKVPGPRRSLLLRAAGMITNSPRPSPTYSVSIRSASLTIPGGNAVSIDVAMLTVLNQNRLYAKEGALRQRRERRTTMILEVRHEFALPAPAAVSADAQHVSRDAISLPAGTHAQIMLTKPLSGSASVEGDPIEAQLLQPVVVDGNVVIPEGSRFEGRIARCKAPRRLSRAAALRLNFNKLILPGGISAEVSTALSTADTDTAPHTHLDAEGGVSGGSPGKMRLAIDLGVSYLTGKIADDLLEEGIKYALGAAASGSATVAARYVGIGTGLFFFAMQKGNDVRLPRYSELDLTLSRSVSLAVGLAERSK